MEVPEFSLALGPRPFATPSGKYHQILTRLGTTLPSFAKSLGYSKNLSTVEVYTINHRHYRVRGRQWG